jgi:opacity protein-like surface antigen
MGGNMSTKILAALGVALLLPSLAAAQSAESKNKEPSWNARPRFEIVISVAMSHIFRFEDEGFGNHRNFGIGIDVPIWHKLRIGADINRTFGFEPTPANCGSILFNQDQPMPCTGFAREGVSSATAGSITASYFFGEGRVQPYLVGGLSILNAKEFRSTSIVHPEVVEFGETETSSTGIGPTFGAGLRISVNRHISIRPEARFADGTARSTLNLSQWRISIGAAYGW